MKRIIVRYLTILGMICSGIWFGVTPSWEPVTVLLFSLASFIATDVTSKEERIKTVCYELKENFNVAKSAEPWTTYSLRGRAIIEELKSLLGEEVYKKIVDLYLKLETTNTKIKNVGKGWWGNDISNSCYEKFIVPITEVISLLKEKINFKRYLE